MKRRCFECYVFTDVESNFIVQCHTGELLAHLLTCDPSPLCGQKTVQFLLNFEKKPSSL